MILSDAARALPAQRLDALLRALAAELRRRPEVARVIDVRSLKYTCPQATDEPEDALVCRAFTRTAAALLGVAPPAHAMEGLRPRALPAQRRGLLRARIARPSAAARGLAAPAHSLMAGISGIATRVSAPMTQCTCRT